MAKATYKDAGVDLEVYDEAMARLPRLLHRTQTPRVIPLDGGFAGLFSLDFAGPLFARKYQDPVLVSCTDGVGTKVKLAIQANKHDTVGIDLVGMSVNDALCCGAEPLFFLDYVAMSHDDPARLEQIVQGVTDGCLQADCALLGGETAIMPDLYAHGEYDLAGFCVGVAERKRVIDGKAIAPGDVILGLASTGFHSNGYSLVRRVVKLAECDIEKHVDELGTTPKDALLAPTRIYVKPVRAVLNNYQKKHVVHGIAHITGGGLHGNLERIIPANCRAEIDRYCWPMPPVFRWLQKLGEIEDDEMDRVFNMGLGLVLVVGEYYAESIRRQVQDMGVDCFTIGKIVPGEGGCAWA